MTGALAFATSEHGVGLDDLSFRIGAMATSPPADIDLGHECVSE